MVDVGGVGWSEVEIKGDKVPSQVAMLGSCDEPGAGSSVPVFFLGGGKPLQKSLI